MGRRIWQTKNASSRRQEAANSLRTIVRTVHGYHREHFDGTVSSLLFVRPPSDDGQFIASLVCIADRTKPPSHQPNKLRNYSGAGLLGWKKRWSTPREHRI
jgi:hypothetical protein